MPPPAREAGDSWPSRKAPCSVKTKRVPLSPTAVNSTVASETEIHMKRVAQRSE